MDQPTKICQTCLAKDRKLLPISDFRHLLCDINLWEIMDNQGDVCLECHRTITKYYSFKTQAAKAQALLGNVVQAPSSDPLSPQNCNTMLLNADENPITEDLLVKREDATVEVEDRNVKVEDRNVKVEDRNVKVKDINVKVKELNVNVEDKMLEHPKVDESLDFDSLGLSDDDDELLSDLRNRKEETVNSKPFTLPALDDEEKQPVINKQKRKRENIFVKYKSIKHSLGTTIKNEGQGDIGKMYSTVMFSEEEIKQIRDNKMAQPNYKQLPYKCDACVHGFKKIDVFNEHLARKHHENAGSEICEVCLCRFRTKCSLEKHRRTHYEVHKCNVCEYKSPRLALMEGHIETKHGSDRVDRIHCQACSEVFSNTEELSKHTEKEHRLACDECDLTFKRADNLRSHKRKIHNSKRDYKCDECKLTFKTVSRLESHIVRHGPKIAMKMAYCQPCGKQFKDINRYRHHLNDSARHAKDTLKCPVCEVLLYSKVYLKKHMAFYHLNKVKYSCNECSKPFISKFRLRNHLRTQHGIGAAAATRSHECNECGKKFTTAPTLRSHQLTHRPERSRMCALCGDTFKQNAALYNHTRLVHSGEKRKKTLNPNT